jgi:hypothetical protein
VQVPLQQLAFDEQFWLSETHAVAPHFPETQERPQHSVELVQLAPLGAHAVLAAQVCVAASQIAEQQLAPDVQTSPYLWHVGGGMTGAPPTPAVPAVPAAPADEVPPLPALPALPPEPLDAPLPALPPEPFDAPVPVAPVPVSPPPPVVPPPPLFPESGPVAPCPIAPDPIAPEPFAPEPFAPEPFAPEPFAPEPFAPEPFAPEPLFAPKLPSAPASILPFLSRKELFESELLQATPTAKLVKPKTTKSNRRI